MGNRSKRGQWQIIRRWEGGAIAKKWCSAKRHKAKTYHNGRKTKAIRH